MIRDVLSPSIPPTLPRCFIFAYAVSSDGTISLQRSAFISASELNVLTMCTELFYKSPQRVPISSARKSHRDIVLRGQTSPQVKVEIPHNTCYLHFHRPSVVAQNSLSVPLAPLEGQYSQSKHRAAHVAPSTVLLHPPGPISQMSSAKHSQSAHLSSSFVTHGSRRSSSALSRASGSQACGVLGGILHTDDVGGSLAALSPSGWTHGGKLQDRSRLCPVPARI